MLNAIKLRLSYWISQGQKWLTKFVNWPNFAQSIYTGNTKGGSIIEPMTSCLTGLESAVWQLPIFVFICKTDYSKSVKQEVNHTVILPPLVFPGLYNVCDARIPDKLIRITKKCDHSSYPISELIKVSTKGLNKMFVELDEIVTCHWKDPLQYRTKNVFFEIVTVLDAVIWCCIIWST
jgi:hypothetical protein